MVAWQLYSTKKSMLCDRRAEGAFSGEAEISQGYMVRWIAAVKVLQQAVA